MFRLLFLSVILLLLMGCSSKKEQDLLKSYSKNIEYHKKLQQTETLELALDGQRVAMITATYLFRATLDKNDNRDEEFIIAVEFEDENARMNFSKTSSSLLAEVNKAHENNNIVGMKEYTLTLKGKKAIKVEKISQGDIRLKNLSFLTSWSEYYKVTFKHTPSKLFNLKFSSKSSNDVLTFSKVAKFVYTQKGF